MTPGFFNPFPKYLQIRDVLTRRLADGFQPGDRLPTEHALSGQFGVSRETVREALAGLEKDGVIRRHRGRGTFMVRRPEPSSDRRLTGLVEDFTDLKLDSGSEVLEKGLAPAPPFAARALKLANGAPVFRIRRLRRFDGMPLSHHDAFLPIDIGARLSRLDLRKTTLMGEIRHTLGIDIVEDSQQIDAVVADTDMAALLGVAVGAPLLCVRRFFVSSADEPVVTFQAHFRADRYYYTVKLAAPRAAPSRSGRRRRGSMTRER